MWQFRAKNKRFCITHFDYLNFTDISSFFWWLSVNIGRNRAKYLYLSQRLSWKSEGNGPHMWSTHLFRAKTAVHSDKFRILYPKERHGSLIRWSVVRSLRSVIWWILVQSGFDRSLIWKWIRSKGTLQITNPDPDPPKGTHPGNFRTDNIFQHILADKGLDFRKILVLTFSIIRQPRKDVYKITNFQLVPR